MSTSIKFMDDIDLVEITLSLVPFHGIRKAYWGWQDSGEMLTEAQVIALQESADFTAGSTIVADFRDGNAAPKYLFMAELQIEQIKTQWYATELDQGEIGPDGLFSIIGSVGAYRVYRSSQKTQFSNPTEFRI